jgi:formylmethanofuran dehydrogenase subunit D
MGDPYQRPLDSVTIEMWLQELRMECYKKNLEDYPNLKCVVELKDADLKRLGILNAKDRATMMGSLSKYIVNAKSKGSDLVGVSSSNTHSVKKSSGINMKR